ncbi:MAG TPA: endonuclease/exonuclease/phosphatase family protein [Vicinamibacterales bacterium]|nr:endonuclease/exonuclease/phosphatase family protein [Vicinamibacterales bacterium]
MDSGDVVRGFTLKGFAALSSSVVISLGVSVAAGQIGVRVAPQPSDMLVHSPLGACRTGDHRGAEATHLRIATWNIRAARSAPLSDIAAEVAAMQADVIALQEVDVRTRRSGFVDEPAALAAALGFHYAFAASIKWDEGDYGLAVLSRWPLTDIRRHRLDATTAIEPRIVLETTACARGRPLRLFNHHADGWVASRESGFAELRQIVRAHMGRGLFVLGDLNEQPDGLGIRGLIETGLVDLGSELGVRAENRRRIDYLLADPSLARASSRARVWPTDKSDHHAMLADIEW